MDANIKYEHKCQCGEVVLRRTGKRTRWVRVCGVCQYLRNHQEDTSDVLWEALDAAHQELSRIKGDKG